MENHLSGPAITDGSLAKMSLICPCYVLVVSVGFPVEFMGR